MANKSLPKTCSFPECPKVFHARKLCRGHYEQWHEGKELTPLGNKSKTTGMTFDERFWFYTEITRRCWNWTGAKNELGYGRLGDGQRLIRAHRYSYEQAYGPIPEGVDIDHICHNPSCVRPFHLRQATHKQNMEHRKGAQRNSSTGVRGVTVAPNGDFFAQVHHHGKHYRAGTHKTLEAAERAAIAKRNELFSHNAADPRATKLKPKRRLQRKVRP